MDTKNPTFFRVRFYPHIVNNIFSDHQKNSVSGIVFERYIEHMFYHLIELSKLEGIAVYARKPISKIFELVGLDTGSMYSVWIDGALFLTSSPLWWASEGHLERLLESKRLYWWEKQAIRSLLDKSFKRLTVTKFSDDRHRPDFVFLGKKGSKIYAFIGDAKYRGGSLENKSKRTSLSAEDIRRLMVYWRILQFIAYKKKWKIGALYVFGNQPRVWQWSYKMEEDEGGEKHLTPYRSWDVNVEEVTDNFWGKIEEMKLYPKGSLQKGLEEEPIFKIRYVSMSQLVKYGLVDDEIIVVVAPRRYGTKASEKERKVPYYVVSRAIPSNKWGRFVLKEGGTIEGYILYDEGSFTVNEERALRDLAFSYSGEGVEIKEVDKKTSRAHVLKEHFLDILQFIKENQPVKYLDLISQFGGIRTRNFLSVARANNWIKGSGYEIRLAKDFEVSHDTNW